MRVYLASPNTQQQAQALIESRQPALLSFALYSDWMDQYAPCFERVLIDSGAYSAYNSGKSLDPIVYRDWSAGWVDRADAIAGLDDIAGDWRKSLRNYEVGGGFPTFHDSDPSELLEDLIPLARERGGWIGIGLTVPRNGKLGFIRSTLEQIPQDLHVHGWACRAYSRHWRWDSLDSTNWWRDAMALRKAVPWIHYGEALELICRRYARENRDRDVPIDGGLFARAEEQSR